MVPQILNAAKMKVGALRQVEWASLLRAGRCSERYHPLPNSNGDHL